MLIRELLFVYLTPLLVGAGLLMPFRLKEKTIAQLSALSLLLPAVVSLVILVCEILFVDGPGYYQVIALNIFGANVPISLWIDGYSVAMLALTHLLGLLVVRYAHGYLHLEKGYQRFFATILFFIFGMYLISLSGTLALFFAGWEIVGISSFFLIGFYRAHNRSLSNALRIYNLFRVCDVGLLLGAGLGHVLWDQATNFAEIQALSSAALDGLPIATVAAISLLLIFAALGKSAQFPFHAWPARAMEGPTPSSAIFYGALSIHVGVFLLIRTEPLWSHLWATRASVAAIGLITFVLSTFQGKVQSNIKAQLAYASTAQLGIMFFELSLGFTQVAMAHLCCHAVYRCFQLLVSPSIVAASLQISSQALLDKLKRQRNLMTSWLGSRAAHTLYLAALSDFSLDLSGRGFNFLPWNRYYLEFRGLLGRPMILWGVLVFGVTVFSWFSGFTVSTTLLCSLALASLISGLRSRFYYNDALFSMSSLVLALVLNTIVLAALDPHTLNGLFLYWLAGAPAVAIGLGVCWRFRGLNLQDFHGLGVRHPLAANCFLLCFLVISGAPISPIFIGEEIILEALISHSLALTLWTVLLLMISGMVCVRIYARLFMGMPVEPTGQRTSA